MPEMTVPRCFAPILKKKKRFKILVSGRGAGKSMTVADILILKAQTEGIKILACREFQSSIIESVHSLVSGEIERLGAGGFTIQNNEISNESGGQFIFKGMARNPESIKSMNGVDIAWVEEASTLSEDSLRMLTPTIREAGSEIWMTANQDSREDPFNKRFINPFESELLRDGYYEDDDHIIIKTTYEDNPFFPDVLMQEMESDKKFMSPAMWRHVWLGDTLDDVENSLIQTEWFNACIDAHIKLGFKPQGAKIAAHDPSDTGPDSKGYAMRHGVVFLDIQEKTDGDGNEGGHWAAGLANSQQVDFFTWDADGMGCLLAEQMAKDFNGKHTRLAMFKGSESPDNPETIYTTALKSPVSGQAKVKDSVKNKRAQYYAELRDRVYRTYVAVENGEKYQDPDTLISFSSDISMLPKLRAEMCRMPIKPNGAGKIDLYTKEEMKGPKFKFASPNLSDSVMMSMRFIQPQIKPTVLPRPIRAMGIRR